MESTHKVSRVSVPVLAGVAGVLGTLVAFQAFGQLGGPAGTRSGMMSQIGGYSVMTSDMGTDDMVLVLDNRNEELMVYRTEGGSMQMYQRVTLPRLFTDARARNQGKP